MQCIRVESYSSGKSSQLKPLEFYLNSRACVYGFCLSFEEIECLMLLRVFFAVQYMFSFWIRDWGLGCSPCCRFRLYFSKTANIHLKRTKYQKDMVIWSFGVFRCQNQRWQILPWIGKNHFLHIDFSHILNPLPQSSSCRAISENVKFTSIGSFWWKISHGWISRYLWIKFPQFLHGAMWTYILSFQS